MRETMETMEAERAEMVAEVEAQIEKALASMAVDVDESDYTDSRPGSRVSSRPGSRVSSRDAAGRVKQLRSFGTESTLAESYDGHATDDVSAKTDLSKGAVIEEDEEEEEEDADGEGGGDGDEGEPGMKKRFSAAPNPVETRDDGMMAAVDAGISERSDRIARKVLEIQQKVCLRRRRPFPQRSSSRAFLWTAGKRPGRTQREAVEEPVQPRERERAVRGEAVRLRAPAPAEEHQAGRQAAPQGV